MRRITRLLSARTNRAYAAAVGVIMIAVVCAIAGIWVFGRSGATEGSVWSLIVADRWALGFVRVAIVAVGLYAAASVAALIASGRWIRALSTAGFEADDPRGADERLEEAQARMRELARERDQAYRLLEEFLNG